MDSARFSNTLALAAAMLGLGLLLTQLWPGPARGPAPEQALQDRPEPADRADLPCWLHGVVEGRR